MLDIGQLAQWAEMEFKKKKNRAQWHHWADHEAGRITAVVEPTDKVGWDTMTNMVRRREKWHDEGEGGVGWYNKGGGCRELNARHKKVYQVQPNFWTTRHCNPNTHKSNDTREWRTCHRRQMTQGNRPNTGMDRYWSMLGFAPCFFFFFWCTYAQTQGRLVLPWEYQYILLIYSIIAKWRRSGEVVSII